MRSRINARSRRWAIALAAVVVVPAGCPCHNRFAVAASPHEWSQATPAEVGLDEAKLVSARDYALQGAGSGYIVRHGRLVMSWGDSKQRYDLKSTTKSFGSIALGLAIRDGKVRLEDPAIRHHATLGIPPESNADTGWINEITILHLASQTAGFEKPGGYTPLLFQPGTQWDYSDSGPNWLAECLTLAYRRDLDALMFERVFSPLGITRADLTWRTHAYRPPAIDGIPRREFGSGIHANVDAMARIGLLMLREGSWGDREILSADYVRRASSVPPGHDRLPVLRPDDYGEASRHYGLLWWNNADGTLPDVAREAYWSWGLYDSLIVVMPSLDLVVARAGKSLPRNNNQAHYDVLKPFLVPIAQSATASNPPRPDTSTRPNSSADSTYPPSSVIRSLRWAPADTILRRAPGSDNWPTTWGDDDMLYTAYGDGRGFEPFAPAKLSLGLARVRGTPPNLAAENVPVPSLEQLGDGASGRKASGLLMVDHVLYLWARNATNSQLAWSTNRGVGWSWADWRFTNSFGCPTFLNFGPNYAGARDDYAYVYSADAETAYERSDHMVMARVPTSRILQRHAYEFLESLGDDGQPRWTRDIARRGPVFTNRGRCYRSTISYCAPLRRYLWVHTGLGDDTRFAGGLAIYDAPEPWGPWTRAYAAELWDVGPGETAGFPPKWMSDDGRTLHLLFSGNDCFSVRAVALDVHR